MDCGRPRQVSELWAALVRTTGLSNLPPWRACERTGQHLGRGEVTRGTRAGASRASGWILGSWSRRRPGPATASQSLQQSAELVAQDQRRPPAGHCRRHNQQSGELVDQGQQIEVSAGHEPEDVAPVSSSTRASDASDARRSHRSVEGDEKPHGERERERHTAKNPRYYIRAFEFTAISGLGRFGGRGVASPATSSTIIMSSTWASVVPDGRVPKDYPRHFDGLSARPGAPVSRRPPRNRAHRGPRA